MKSGFALEPAGLLKAFLEHPPQGFAPRLIADAVPAFLTRYDLLTTASARVQRALSPVRRFLPKPVTLFVGTTVSEYAPFPEEWPAAELVSTVLRAFRESGASFLIVKDLPQHSPLLSAAANAQAAAVLSEFLAHGFIQVCGEALAYVPIDFTSTEELLARFSRSRRKDLRRKLRSREQLAIGTVPTGDPFFSEARLAELYGLYLNVYQGSEVHFDLLTPEFFRAVFLDPASGGLVVLYRHDGRIIGFNLCFICKQMLVDKYVGFSYPEATACNLYFVSWFHNLELCLQQGLSHYVAGWTDPEVKAYLGARFTYTQHAVRIRNPVLFFLLSRVKAVFESDRQVLTAAPAGD